MPLYELVCISRSVAAKVRPFGVQASSILSTPSFAKSLNSTTTTPEPDTTEEDTVKDTVTPKLMKISATHVLDNGGVVRKFEHLGHKQLPYRMKRHQTVFTEGRYWTMLFDASPKTMEDLSTQLGYDERVIRHTMLKMGESLKTITKYTPPEQLV
ncbi:hypothetical protein HK097_001181 [Rhizophlyctis rosea]|uniref:Mitochondrial ribosomal protein S6 n=1 Tax=Rhizophlyctis rosea TaxID=64517 RepID=A0AAD5X244_9FUNG|nr:hypothetical protein HK097_001181 [Rhizophlyctis rosea]